jgi:hypothetical protein
VGYAEHRSPGQQLLAPAGKEEEEEEEEEAEGRWRTDVSTDVSGQRL